MRKGWISLALMLLCSCGEAPPNQTEPASALRLISLAPNITETLYALHLEDQIVGITTYCTLPSSGRSIARIGGFGHFNYEQIVSLQPDLVIGHAEFKAERDRLEALGISYLETRSSSMADILETIEQIGHHCDAEQRAEELIQDLRRQMGSPAPAADPAPRVLLVFGGSAGERLGQVQSFGAASLHSELLNYVGGSNVVERAQPYVNLSEEAVMRLNPEVVIILAPELEDTRAEIRRWERLVGVDASANHRIHVLTDEYTCIPGPRFVLLMNDFRRIIGSTRTPSQ